MVLYPQSAAGGIEGLLDNAFDSLFGVAGGIAGLLSVVGIVLVIWGVIQLFSKSKLAALLKIGVGAFCVAPFVIWGAAGGLIGGVLDFLVRAADNATQLL